MKNLLACDAFLTFGRRLSGKTLSARLTLCCNIRKNRDTPVFDNVPRNTAIGNGEGSDIGIVQDQRVTGGRLDIDIAPSNDKDVLH